MKSHYVCSLFLALTLPLCAAHGVKGASLFGKVIEITDGDAITIFNLNRPVRVRLMGIDAPEVTQAFGDIARQHLSDLIYDKFVTVEYSGLGSNSSLVGRVLFNDQDVGAQMIRDGVAWYDPNYKNRLSETERDIYIQSQEAARNEKRGLWQADHPVAPWDFVKARSTGNDFLPGSTRQISSIRSLGSSPGLTSESLLGTQIASGVLLGSSRSAEENRTVNARAASWERLRPDGENFSVLVPNDGKQTTSSVPFGNQVIDVNYYMARDGRVVYALM